MKSLKDYFRCLVEAGNKASSSRFFMIVTLIISCVLYIIVGVILIVDVLEDGEVTTSLDGLSSFVTAVSINLGVGGLTKVGSSIFERKEKDGECE